ncbi:phage holin family protein, partial [Streptomyces roseolilacinus]
RTAAVLQNVKPHPRPDTSAVQEKAAVVARSSV